MPRVLWYGMCFRKKVPRKTAALPWKPALPCRTRLTLLWQVGVLSPLLCSQRPPAPVKDGRRREVCIPTR